MSLWSEFRFAGRALKKDRRFAFPALVALSLGIGAITIIFAVIDGVLLHPFSYKDSERLATVSEHFTSGTLDRNLVSPEEFTAFRDHNHSFRDMIGIAPIEILYGTAEGTHETWGAWISSESFDVLGAKPLLGRQITREDGNPDAPPVFVISYSLWMNEFNGNASFLGKPVALNGELRTLIAVMPPRFRLLDCDIWIPLTITPSTNVMGVGNVRPAHFRILGHLKEGVSLQAAESDLTPIFQQYQEHHPKDYPEKIVLRARNFIDSVVGELRSTLLALMIAVSLLLLIACCNVANLLLARATVREKEIAIRAAMGAGRARLIREILIEGVLLAGAGCAAGCLLAYGGARVVAAMLPPYVVPTEARVSINSSVLVLALCIAFATTLLCGIAPSLHAIRGDLARRLQLGGQTGSMHQGRLRSALVISEVALSIVLLIASGMMMRSFLSLHRIELGFNPHNVLMARIPLPQEAYGSVEQKKMFFETVESRLARSPGVVSVAVSYTFPPCCPSPSVLSIPGKTNSDLSYVLYEPVNAGFFPTLGISLLQGRLITASEVSAARRVAVVNEAFARTFFPNENPIGHDFELASFNTQADYPHNAYFEIVGIVADIKNQGLEKPAKPEAFIPYTSFGRTNRSIFVKTSQSPESMLPRIQQEIWKIEPRAALSQVTSLERFLEDRSYSRPKLELRVLTAYSALGLLLVILGIFSVTAYTVTLQTHEIGIRMALGAQRANVLRLVLLKALRQITIGIIVGLTAGLAATRVISQRFWGFSRVDPMTMTIVTLVLLAVGLTAALIPARRATFIDPLIAIRHE